MVGGECSALLKISQGMRRGVNEFLSLHCSLLHGSTDTRTNWRTQNSEWASQACGYFIHLRSGEDEKSEENGEEFEGPAGQPGGRIAERRVHFVSRAGIAEHLTRVRCCPFATHLFSLPARPFTLQ